MTQHTYIALRNRDDGDAASLHQHPQETDDGFTPKQPRTPPRSVWHGRNRRPLLLGLGALTALTLLFAFSAPHTTIPWPQRWGSHSAGYGGSYSFAASSAAANSNSTTAAASCGDSPQTAAQAGCVFDLVAFAWVSPACRAPEDKGRKDDKFGRWWADARGEEEVAREEVAGGERERVYVGWEDGARRCVHLWRTLQRGVLAEAPLDSLALDEGVASACGDLLVSGMRAAADTKVELVVQYTACGREA